MNRCLLALWASLLISGVNLSAAENSRQPNVLFIMTDQQRWDCLGAVSHVDHEIGEILDTLERTGQAANTLIVFASDHGDQLLEHGIMGKNCSFESSVHVPLLVSLPGRVQPRRYAELVEAVDVLPTLLELLGLPEPCEVQGRSFAPLIAPMGRRYEARDAVFSENIIPEVITGGRLDLPFEKGRGVDGVRHPDAKMIRTARWKYNYYPAGFAELYDLQTDPGERVNLAGRAEAHAVEVEMKDRLLRWLTTASETDQIAPRWRLQEATK